MGTSAATVQTSSPRNGASPVADRRFLNGSPPHLPDEIGDLDGLDHAGIGTSPEPGP